MLSYQSLLCCCVTNFSLHRLCDWQMMQTPSQQPLDIQPTSSQAADTKTASQQALDIKSTSQQELDTKTPIQQALPVRSSGQAASRQPVTGEVQQQTESDVSLSLISLDIKPPPAVDDQNAGSDAASIPPPSPV